MEHLLEKHPSSPIYVASRFGIQRHHHILPPEDRHRLFLRSEDGDFLISDTYRSEAEGAEIYSLKIYGNTIFTIRDLALAGGAKVDDVHRRIHLDATSSDGPIIDSDWDVYLMDRQLVYVRESCSVGDTDAGFFLHLYPADVSDLPEEREQFGFDNLDFGFHFYQTGAMLGFGTGSVSAA